MIKHKDIEGKELKVGDLVICTVSAKNGILIKSVISRFTPRKVKVKWLDSNGKASDYEQQVTYPRTQIYKLG